MTLSTSSTIYTALRHALKITAFCLFHSDLVIASTDKPRFSKGNERYTEVQDTGDQKEEKLYIDRENENPLYEAADVGDAVFNPIYDRFGS